LEILEITELFPDRFKGIFKFIYNGDATLTLHTKVQANPLSTIHPFKKQTLNIKSRINLAAKPFLVPMDMSISNLQMKAIVVLVVDKMIHWKECW
jgi:mitochondrial distribution and morphology protein 34